MCVYIYMYGMSVRTEKKQTRTGIQYRSERYTYLCI